MDNYRKIKIVGFTPRSEPRLSALPETGRFKRLADRWFPARQILVRGPDRIAAIDVSQRAQLAVAGTALGLVLWAVCASVGVVISFHSVANVVIADAKLHAAEHANEVAVDRMLAENQALAAQRDEAVARMTSLRWPMQMQSGMRLWRR